MKQTGPACSKCVFTVCYCMFTVRYCMFTLRYCMFTLRYCMFTLRYCMFTLRYCMFTLRYCMLTLRYWEDSVLYIQLYLKISFVKHSSCIFCKLVSSCNRVLNLDNCSKYRKTSKIILICQCISVSQLVVV